MATPTICQTPAIVDLAFQPGDTISFDVALKNSASLPIDITHYTLDAYILYENTKYDFMITIVNALLGEITLTMSGEVSITIPEGSTWSFIVTTPTMETFTYMTGKVKFQTI